MSYGFRVDSGRRSSSDSSRRSIGSLTGSVGGASSQFDGKNERYFFERPRGTPRRPRTRRRRRRYFSVWTLRAAELLLADVLTRHRLDQRRPAERQRADVLHHRHEVGEARDIRGARRARADHRRDLRDDAAHDAPARGTVPGAGEQRDHVPVLSRPDRCARRRSR